MTETLVKEGRQAVKNYDKLVQAGVRNTKALNEARWNLGKLGLEVAPELAKGGDDRGASTKNAAASLEQYAKDINIEYITLKEYRRVVASWRTPDPPSDIDAWETVRTLASAEDVQKAYKVAKKLAHNDGREVVSRDDARKAVGLKEAHGADEGMKGKTLTELAAKAAVAIEYMLRRVQANPKAVDKEGAEALEMLDYAEKRIAQFRALATTGSIDWEEVWNA